MRPALLIMGLLLAPLAGCDKQGAWGDANSIILVTSTGLWDEIEEDVRATLEPTILTVRDERMFTVTHQDPAAEQWPNVQVFRQLLLIESADAPWLATPLAELRSVPEPPAIAQVRDVWARNQLVTIVLLPATGKAEALAELLPELGETYDRQYRGWAENRMFMSGRDTALADTLAREAGFSLLFPEVYRWAHRDSSFLFRNDNPDPSELIRQIGVTWLSPAPEQISKESLAEWRQELVESSYEDAQLLDLSKAEYTRLEVAGRRAHQLQAIWQNPPEAEWPAAGPLIFRAVECPDQDRLYLLDAWLYAPQREKYEYMIQLQTLLDSFRCGSAARAG